MKIVIFLIYSLIELIAASTYFIYFPILFQIRPWVDTKKRQIISILAITIIDYVLFDVAGRIMDALNISKSYVTVNSLLFLAVTFVVGIIFFEGKKTTTLLFSILHLFIAIMIEGLTTSIAALFIQTDLYTAFEGELFMAMMGLANAIIRFILVLSLYHFFKNNRVDYRRSGKVYFFQTFIPVVSCLMFIAYYSMEFGSRSNPDYLLYIIIVLSILVINIVHYVSFREQEIISAENYRNQLLKQEYEFKEEYYHNVEKHQEEIRTIKHDLKNQLITIGGYIESTDNGGARDQINLIIQDVLEKSEMHFTSLRGIDMLLNAKFKCAQQAGITCDFDIKISEDMKFEERDIASLLGNILDNAIEACQKCQAKRVIKLQLLYYNQALILKSENSTDGLVRDLRTRKKNQGEHGLGLKSVQVIVDRYNGDWDYDIEDKYFRIEVTLWEPR